jgi:hypothetical protein
LQIALIATGPQILLELHENRQEQVPTLYVNVITLITEEEKVSAIAEKFSRANENTVQSPMGAVFVYS